MAGELYFRWGALLGAALAVLVQQVEAAPVGQIEVIAPGQIQVDGVLNEPLYGSKSARWMAGFQRINTLLPEAPEEETRARLFTDGNLLYFAAQLEEPSGRFIARATERDKPVGFLSDDAIELFIRANAQASDFLRISVTVDGIVTDASYTQGGLQHSVEWDADIRVATRRNESNWTVEFSIPLADLDLDPKQREWFIQIIRKRAARDRESGPSVTSWLPIPDAVGMSQPVRATGLGSIASPEVPLSGYGWHLDAGDVEVQRTPSGQFALRQVLSITNYTEVEREVAVTSQLFLRKANAGHYPLPSISGKLAIGANETVAFPVTAPVSGSSGRFEGFLRHRLAEGDAVRIRNTTSIKAAYAKAELRLIEPDYRGAIFASQGVTQVKATLKKVDKGLAITNVTARLVAADGTQTVAQVTEASTAPDVDSWAILIPDLANLERGTYRLEVNFDAGGGAMERLEREIRLLEKREGEVWIDKRGVVHRDGTPFPAYGFCYARWNTLPENRLPDMKINVGGPIFSQPPFDALKETARKLLEAGILSGVDVSRISKTALGFGARGSVEPLTDEEREEYRVFARTVQKIPGFIFYYIYDEPELHSVAPSRLEEIYDILREEDPWHPVVVLNSGSSAVKAYQNAADIFMPDPYPYFIENQQGSSRGHLIRLALENVQTSGDSNRARWLTPQAFSFGLFSAENGRGPTAGEMRTQQVLGLMHGATGFLFYPEYMVWEEPGVQTSLPYLSREFELLFPYIASALPTPIVAQQGGVDAAWAQEPGGEVVIMAANPTQERQRVVLDTALWANVSAWHVLGLPLKEAVEGSAGRLEFELEPFASIVFSSVAPPEGLDWAEVEERERMILHEAIIPGNKAHRSTGTRAAGIRTGSGGLVARLRAGLLIDGLKDQRGVGYSFPFKKGMGIELDFNRDCEISLVRLIDSNLASGFVEAQVPGSSEWVKIAVFDEEEQLGAESRDIRFSGRTVRKLRVIAESLKKVPKNAKAKFTIREVEAYE